MDEAGLIQTELGPTVRREIGFGRAPVRNTHILLCLSDSVSNLSCFSPDNGVSSVDSVFIFQSSAEENTSATYDAIVVEQWTVVDVSFDCWIRCGLKNN